MGIEPPTFSLETNRPDHSTTFFQAFKKIHMEAYFAIFERYMETYFAIFERQRSMLCKPNLGAHSQSQGENLYPFLAS